MKFVTLSLFVTLITALAGSAGFAMAASGQSTTATGETHRPMWVLPEELDDPQPVAKPAPPRKAPVKVSPKPVRKVPVNAAAPKRNTQAQTAPAKAQPRPVKAPVAAAKPPVSKSPPVAASTAADQIIVTDLTRTCAARDAHACFMLGRMYATGTIAVRNDTMAVKSYQRSCDLGSASGCHALGQMHEKGTGTPANASQAARYYQVACKAGNATACKSVKKTSNWFGLTDLFAAKPKAP